MMLPKHRFEPFFMKVIEDFMNHHSIPNTISKPKGNLMPYKLFSFIIDIMAHSMGSEKRKAILEELQAYKMDLPFDLR